MHTTQTIVRCSVPDVCTPTVRIKGEDVKESNGNPPTAATLKAAIKAGHGSVAAGKTGGKGSKTWVVILVIVVVAIAVLVYVAGNQRRNS